MEAYNDFWVCDGAYESKEPDPVTPYKLELVEFLHWACLWNQSCGRYPSGFG